MLRGLQLGSSGKGIDEARLVELADVDETPRAASESEVAVGHEPDEEAGEEADASPPGAGPSGVESVITQVTSPGNALPGFQQGGDQDDDDLAYRSTWRNKFRCVASAAAPPRSAHVQRHAAPCARAAPG
jgi:hypothetical protein